VESCRPGVKSVPAPLIITEVRNAPIDAVDNLPSENSRDINEQEHSEVDGDPRGEMDRREQFESSWRVANTVTSP
jgi:hypothetical protein